MELHCEKNPVVLQEYMNSTEKASLERPFSKRPLIISGPCSAETEDQVMHTAMALARDKRVDVLRFGSWKPRTKPGNFEGNGEESLPWISRAMEATDLPAAIEVASAHHIEKAMAHGIRMFWIGARSTVNPFTVQEIADALLGVKDVSVMIKNPLSPDVELWTGAYERIKSAGVESIALVHRGFSSFSPSKYRNPPMWAIPIEMRQRFPEVPLICDPSHICGNRHHLLHVSQRAIDLDFSGLMIEAHIDPASAWSDAAQQVTPSTLNEMLDHLIWRHSGKQSIRNHPQLQDLRADIDHIDDQIVHLISERMNISTKIGYYKKEHGITVLQNKRWTDIRQRLNQKAKESGLSVAFIEAYLEAIHLESIRKQNEVINK